MIGKINWVCSDESEHGDLGDVGKFYFSSNEMKEKFGISGYVFTCDDDIIYPDWHVSRTIGQLEKHAGKRIIFSYHGSTLPRKCTNYHPQKSSFQSKALFEILLRCIVGS